MCSVFVKIGGHFAKLCTILQRQFYNWVNRISSYRRFQGPHKEYSMLLGRYQCLPPHEGHQGLVDSLLQEGKNVLIALRQSDGTEKNPYGFEERKKAFEQQFKKEIAEKRVKIIEIEDIVEIAYGRAPGWQIKQIQLGQEIEDISATAIRKKINEKKEQ